VSKKHDRLLLIDVGSFFSFFPVVVRIARRGCISRVQYVCKPYRTAKYTSGRQRWSDNQRQTAVRRRSTLFVIIVVVLMSNGARCKAHDTHRPGTFGARLSKRETRRTSRARTLVSRTITAVPFESVAGRRPRFTTFKRARAINRTAIERRTDRDYSKDSECRHRRQCDTILIVRGTFTVSSLLDGTVQWYVGSDYCDERRNDQRENGRRNGEHLPPTLRNRFR